MGVAGGGGGGDPPVGMTLLYSETCWAKERMGAKWGISVNSGELRLLTMRNAEVLTLQNMAQFLLAFSMLTLLLSWN